MNRQCQIEGQDEQSGITAHLALYLVCWRLIEFYYLVIYRYTTILNYSQPWCISLIVSYKEAEDEARKRRILELLRHMICIRWCLGKSWIGTIRGSYLCFMIEVGCLAICWCIPYYSQRRYITLVESYTEGIPDGDAGNNTCDSMVMSRRLCGESPPIEVRCLVIYCCTADVYYILLTNVSYTDLLVSKAFCIQRRLK